MGGGGQTACNAHFSYLNPLKFYICRQLKSTVYAKEFSDVQDLQQRSTEHLR